MSETDALLRCVTCSTPGVERCHTCVLKFKLYLGLRDEAESIGRATGHKICDPWMTTNCPWAAFDGGYLAVAAELLAMVELQTGRLGLPGGGLAVQQETGARFDIKYTVSGEVRNRGG